MAKRGLMFYLVMGFPVWYFGYNLYIHVKYTPQEFKEMDQLEYYKKMEGKEILLTENQIRRQAERKPVKNVPVKDNENGYM